MNKKESDKIAKLYKTHAIRYICMQTKHGPQTIRKVLRERGLLRTLSEGRKLGMSLGRIKIQNKGTHLSEKHKARISRSLKGKKNHLGKKHSEATKRKISLANKGVKNICMGKDFPEMEVR